MIEFNKNNTLFGFLLAFLGTMLFSFKSIFIKLAYAQGLDANSVLMLRMLISLPLYLLIIIYLVRAKNTPVVVIKQNLLFVVFLGFIGYFLSSWLDLRGLEHISAGLERLTLFSYPIFVAVFGVLFFRAEFNRKIAISLALTYLGVFIVFKQEIEFNSDNAVTGLLLVVAAAVCYSFYMLFSRAVIAKIGSLWFTAIAMSVSSIFVLFYYFIFFAFDDLIITNYAWLWMFMLAIFSTVIPSFLISEAISRITPVRTGIVGTIGPIVTIILAVFILDEPFNWHYLLGIALVIFGVLLLILDKKRT